MLIREAGRKAARFASSCPGGAQRESRLPAVHGGARRATPLGVSLLLLKLLLAPTLVALASLAARRFGQRVAGLVASLPIVGGPILGFFAWEHGEEFVARAAEQTLAGTASLAAYCVAYGWMAAALGHRRRRWAFAVLPLAWGVFVATTFILVAMPVSGLASLGLGALGLGVGARSLPSLGLDSGLPRGGPASGRRVLSYPAELGIRMTATAAMVVTLTAAARRLGPDLSGLLTPFPVASTVLLVAAHFTEGPRAAIELLRGFLAGMWGFVAFCVAVAWGAVPLGAGPSFVLGGLGVACVQATLSLARYRSRRCVAEGS